MNQTKGDKKVNGMARRRSRLKAVQGLYMLEKNSELATGEGISLVGDGVWFDETGERDRALASLEKLASDGVLLEEIAVGSRGLAEEVGRFLEEHLEQKASIGRIPLLLRCTLQAAMFELKDLQSENEKRIIVADYVAVASAFFEKKETSLLNSLLAKMIAR